MAHPGTETTPAADSGPEPVTHGTADRTVVIVDNGGVPYAVHISYSRRVATLCRVKDYQRPKEAGDVIRSFQFRRALIGLDPNEPEALQQKAAASASGADGGTAQRAAWWHGGTSVLLDMGDDRYVCVGVVVTSFRVTPGDEIREYVSKMGNSAVTYPYAVGAHNTYMLVDNTYIPNEVLEQHSPEERQNPYDVLYSDSLARWLPGAGPGVEPPRHLLQAWHDAFPLQDVEVVVPRRKWDD